MSTLCEFCRVTSTVRDTLNKIITGLISKNLLLFHVFTVIEVNVLRDMPFLLKGCFSDYCSFALEAQFMLHNVFQKKRGIYI